MRKNLKFVFLLTAIVFSLSSVSYGQGERKISAGASKYVISAEAGGVNYVEGKVTVSRENETSGYLLKGDELKIGDVIETGVDGKTEILLNPGSYARLGKNTSFEFIDTSLEDLQLKLNSGNAIFEVITTKGFYFTIKTPKAEFNVVKSGVYRVDVLNDGTSKIEVWKGRAQIGEGKEGKVKKGRAATVDGDDFAIAKFDRGERDDFEEWSKTRSKKLTKANSKFKRRNVRGPLITSFNLNRWNLYDSFGVWVYNPYLAGFTFLPFGYGWSSPYGFRYRRDLWYCRLPRYIYFSPPPRRNPVRRDTTGNRRGATGVSRPVDTRTRTTNRTSRNTPRGGVVQRNRTTRPSTRRVNPRPVTIPRRSSSPRATPRRTSKPSINPRINNR